MGTWITREETNVGPPAWGKQHGYCFDVPVSADGTVPAVSIPEMGRFSHEACAVDPETWVDIADPNPPGTGATAVFDPGFAGGGARFGRLEGCWWGHGALYFASTNGGNAGLGQVWQFRPRGGDHHDWDDDVRIARPFSSIDRVRPAGRTRPHRDRRG